MQLEAFSSCLTNDSIEDAKRECRNAMKNKFEVIIALPVSSRHKMWLLGRERGKRGTEGGGGGERGTEREAGESGTGGVGGKRETAPLQKKIILTLHAA